MMLWLLFHFHRKYNLLANWKLFHDTESLINAVSQIITLLWSIWLFWIVHFVKLLGGGRFGEEERAGILWCFYGTWGCKLRMTLEYIAVSPELFSTARYMYMTSLYAFSVKSIINNNYWLNRNCIQENAYLY